MLVFGFFSICLSSSQLILKASPWAQKAGGFSSNDVLGISWSGCWLGEALALYLYPPLLAVPLEVGRCPGHADSDVPRRPAMHWFPACLMQAGRQRSCRSCL